MTKTVNSLDWNISDASNAVAVVAVDFGTDQTWAIKIVGNSQITPANIVPAYVTFDNIENSVSLTAFVGPYTWIVPAYSRKTFALPANAGTLTLNGTSGNINVYFSQTNSLTPDDSDWLKIQEQALGISVFPWTLYNAINIDQTVSDLAGNVAFANTAIANYILLGGANLKNGSFCFLHNESEFDVNVTPQNGETINSVFTFAAPLILFPGESGFLQWDGQQWQYRQFGGKTGIINTTVAIYAQTLNDLRARLLFSFAGAKSYNLLSAASFEIGDRIKIQNIATGILSIIPNGIEKIAGTFTNAAPLVLSPFDSITLFVDDSGSWNLEGEITYTSANIGFGPGVYGNSAHKLGKAPDFIETWIICTVATHGYNVGDKWPQRALRDSNYVPVIVSLLSDAINIKYQWPVSGANQYMLADLTTPTSGSFQPTTTGGVMDDFAFFLKAKVRW